MLFSVALTVEMHACTHIQPHSQTDTQTLAYACVIRPRLRHTQKPSGPQNLAFVLKSHPFLLRQPHHFILLTLPAHWGGLHSVYSRNIWQRERSSGGYYVSLGKWVTPWEGEGRWYVFHSSWVVWGCCATSKQWRRKTSCSPWKNKGRKSKRTSDLNSGLLRSYHDPSMRLITAGITNFNNTELLNCKARARKTAIVWFVSSHRQAHWRTPNSSRTPNAQKNSTRCAHMHQVPRQHVLSDSTRSCEACVSGHVAHTVMG